MTVETVKKKQVCSSSGHPSQENQRQSEKIVPMVKNSSGLQRTISMSSNDAATPPLPVIRTIPPAIQDHNVSPFQTTLSTVQYHATCHHQNTLLIESFFLKPEIKAHKLYSFSEACSIDILVFWKKID